MILVVTHFREKHINQQNKAETKSKSPFFQMSKKYFHKGMIINKSGVEPEQRYLLSMYTDAYEYINIIT